MAPGKALGALGRGRSRSVAVLWWTEEAGGGAVTSRTLGTGSFARSLADPSSYRSGRGFSCRAAGSSQQI